MAPQATAPPAPPEETQPDPGAEWADLVHAATQGDTPGARQVKRALALENDRAAIMRKIADNREFLRLMQRTEELNEDQAEFVTVFYPEKEKGERRSQAEIEATRKAHEAARKNSKK